MATLQVKIKYEYRRHSEDLGYNAWRVRWERFGAGEWQEVSVTDHPFRTPHADFKATVPGEYRASVSLTNGVDVGSAIVSENTIHVFEPDTLAVALGEA